MNDNRPPRHTGALILLGTFIALISAATLIYGSSDYAQRQIDATAAKVRQSPRAAH